MYNKTIEYAIKLFAENNYMFTAIIIYYELEHQSTQTTY